MKIEDFRKLKLFLNMTPSGSDQEVLTAMRKANEIVARSNTTWDRILDRVIKVEVEIESREQASGRSSEPSAVAARRAAHAKRVEEAFAAIEATDPRGEFADFVADVKAQWERTGRLSDAQYEAIMRSARRAEERRT